MRTTRIVLERLRAVWETICGGRIVSPQHFNCLAGHELATAFQASSFGEAIILATSSGRWFYHPGSGSPIPNHREANIRGNSFSESWHLKLS
jgi:hypothetical protein